MRKFVSLVFLWLYVAGRASAGIPPAPDPPRLVNDFTGTLSEEQKNVLEESLLRYHDTTSTQITVVIVSTTDGIDPAQYAYELGEAWGVGQSKYNNGVVLLIAREDRAVEIATGYGVEGALPDALCRRIIENEIIPRFRENDFYGGISNGAQAIMDAIGGEYIEKTSRRNNADGPSPLAIVLVVLGIGLVIFLKVVSVNRYAQLNNIPFWVAWSIINAASNRSGRSSSGGGFGGFGGGGFGGGSFGGFGGGSFGGGGAGGRW